jgi:pimeloyl-ACP methyl ester carboxylesterase
VFVGGLGSDVNSAHWAALQSQLASSAGYSSSDFVSFSYDGWSMAPGSSKLVSNAYTTAQTCAPIQSSDDLLASMLRFLRDNQRASSVSLVGHSLGGVIAYDVAANALDLSVAGDPFIRRVVTIDSPLGGIGAWRSLEANVAFGANLNGCAASDDLLKRKRNNAQHQAWLASTAESLLARGVQLFVVSNPNDAWVLQPDQQVDAAVNFSMVVDVPNTHTGHTELLYDAASVSKIVELIGPQAR